MLFAASFCKSALDTSRSCDDDDDDDEDSWDDDDGGPPNNGFPWWMLEAIRQAIRFASAAPAAAVCEPSGLVSLQ